MRASMDRRRDREVKPHKVRYYLERRDAEFEDKMAQVLCIYREVAMLKKVAAASKKPTEAVAVLSYDEKPGIQAIATTAPDLPPRPGVHATFARDHEYKRHGTLSLLAGTDLLTGKVHTLVNDHHRRIASWPPSTRSIDIQSSTHGSTSSTKPHDMIQTSETTD